MGLPSSFFLIETQSVTGQKNSVQKMGVTVYQREICDYKVKLFSTTFYGRRDRKTTFSFFSELRCGPLEVTPEKFPNIFYKSKEMV